MKEKRNTLWFNYRDNQIHCKHNVRDEIRVYRVDLVDNTKIRKSKYFQPQKRLQFEMVTTFID